MARSAAAAPVIENRLGHPGREAVHQLGHGFAAGLASFGKRGEAADIREEKSHVPQLASQPKFRRVPDKLLDQSRRKTQWLKALRMRRLSASV